MQRPDDSRNGTHAATQLTAHAAECEACQRTPLPLERIASLLSSALVDTDPAALSQHTVARLRPELERLARAASWRRVLLSMLMSLLPLPAVAAYDAYFLGLVYDVARVILPTAFAAYLVLSYGAFLVLLFALTYSAIPLLVMRDSRQPAAIDYQLSTAQ